jgi:hypothetical protein
MMADITYDEVVKLAEPLPETEQNKLIYHLRAKQAVQKNQEQSTPVEQPRINEYEWVLPYGSESVDIYRNPTREDLIEELNKLRAAGVFENVESLYGKYANPNLPEISAEEFHAGLLE